MSQAEIAGGTVTPPGELPAKGWRLPDFQLVSSLGHPARLSDYRGRANLVLIFSDDRAETQELMSDVADHYVELKDENADVVAIVHVGPGVVAAPSLGSSLAYPVLIDEDGGTHRRFGAADSQGRDAAAVYIADMFGEVAALYRTRDGDQLPTVRDILGWLAFLNIQCPECEPPEWPL